MATAAVAVKPNTRGCKFCRERFKTKSNEPVVACSKDVCQHALRKLNRESQKTVDRILGVKTYHRRGAGKHYKGK